jgi:hypothetical protein
MKKFSAIKIICYFSIVLLAILEVYIMARFGFNYWLKWMLALEMTDPAWVWALLNFLFVITGLMVWSKIEPVYVAWTPLTILGLYVLFIVVTRFANLPGQILPIGIAHVFFLAVTVFCSPFAVTGINEELKYEWDSSLWDVLAAPTRMFNRLIGLDKKPQEEKPAEIPADWGTLTEERAEPEPVPEPAPQPLGSVRPEKKWYEEMIERQRARYKRG